MNWYADIDGKQYGPFTDRALAVACLEGEFYLSANALSDLRDLGSASVYDEHGRVDLNIYQE